MDVDKIEGVTIGTVLAFVPAGFIVLGAFAGHSVPLAGWLWTATAGETSVGNFFCVLLASVSLGVLISGIRAFSIDTLLYMLGRQNIVKNLPPPALDFAKLKSSDALAAFTGIVENYYKFYQFYSNVAVALVIFWLSHALAPLAQGWPLLYHVALALAVVSLLWSCTDSLRRYSIAITKLQV